MSQATRKRCAAEADTLRPTTAKEATFSTLTGIHLLTSPAPTGGNQVVGMLDFQCPDGKRTWRCAMPIPATAPDGRHALARDVPVLLRGLAEVLATACEQGVV